MREREMHALEMDIKAHAMGPLVEQTNKKKFPLILFSFCLCVCVCVCFVSVFCLFCFVFVFVFSFLSHTFYLSGSTALLGEKKRGMGELFLFPCMFRQFIGNSKSLAQGHACRAINACFEYTITQGVRHTRRHKAETKGKHKKENNTDLIQMSRGRVLLVCL